jgi:voltage-gated potassium channel Kch/phosphohistidine phosphatase SixA
MLTLALPVAFKFGLILVLARVFGATAGTAIRTALALATAGEFGFVLLGQAGRLGLIDELVLQVVLAAMLLSMLIAPLLVQYSDRIALRLSSAEWLQQSVQIAQIAQRAIATDKHVVICGFGRSGQHLGKMLDQEGIPFVALEIDPDLVREAAAAGESVVFGDAARREALVAAGISRASALTITYANTASALKVLHHVQQLRPDVPVIVRTQDDHDLERLTRAGATEVVPEVLEGSLMLGSHALVLLGVPLSRVVRRVRSARPALSPVARLLPQHWRRCRDGRRGRARTAAFGAARSGSGRRGPHARRSRSGIGRRRSHSRSAARHPRLRSESGNAGRGRRCSCCVESRKRWSWPNSACCSYEAERGSPTPRWPPPGCWWSRPCVPNPPPGMRCAPAGSRPAAPCRDGTRPRRSAGYRLDDCSTERNLSADGRAQSARLGKALLERGVKVESVLSSRWCRCLDTARLAFPQHAVTPFDALNSFFDDRAAEPGRTRAALARISAIRAPANVVFVTHHVNILALTGEAVGAGEILVARQPEAYRCGRLRL